jgi:4-azaleucine resistance transporter AzlC
MATISPSQRRSFYEGMRDTLPLIIGAIPFGIIFGTLAGGAGLSAAGAIGMSLFVFAGSAQFVALGMLANGAAWPLIVLTTLVVNFRHLLYSATLLPYLQHLPRRWQAALAFGLTDETFAVSVVRWQNPEAPTHKHWYQLGSMLFMYVNWNLCTIIGVVAGRLLQDIAAWGLDFAMLAAFIGMLIPYFKDRPNYCAMLAAGVCAIVLHGLPHKLGLIVASLVGVGAGVLAERLSATVSGAQKREA